MIDEMQELRREIKNNIGTLLNNQEYPKAEQLLSQYLTIASDDPEAYSMQAVMFIRQSMPDKAMQAIEVGLAMDPADFDLLYNQAYVYEQQEEYSRAGAIYERLAGSLYSEDRRDLAALALGNLQDRGLLKKDSNKRRLVFFVKQGMDSFIDEIIRSLSQEYITQKVIVTQYDQIDQEMAQADICWFEWCDELVAYGSKLVTAKDTFIVCRLHSYEAFADYANQVLWDNVDTVIFVAEHIRNFVLENISGLPKEKTVVIPNGIDVSKYHFENRSRGFNIAYVGYINYKKGPMLLLHAFKAIYDQDSRYKLYIAGIFQDARYVLYFKQMIHEFKLENNVFYQGWQDNLDQWLEDKNYILCTSLLESQNLSVMQAMAKGIKPLIHNFVGAETIYPKSYLWNNIDECVKMIKNRNYNSNEYQNYLKDNFDIQIQLSKIKKVLNEQLEVKNSPLVTVGILNYNYAHYLDKCINSILEQTYVPIDILVIDDCSTDNSIEKLQTYQEQYENIRVIYHEQNSGSAANGMRDIITYANGEFIIFLSADDFLTKKDSVKIFMEDILAKPNVDYVYSNMQVVDGAGNFQDSWVYKEYTLEEMVKAVFERFGSGVVPITVGVFKRDFFTRNNLTWLDDKEDKIADFRNVAADTLNMLRYSKLGMKISHVNENLISYRIHDNNMTYDLKNRVLSIISVIEYIIDNFDENIYFPEVKWSTYNNSERMAVKLFLCGYSYFQALMFYYNGQWQPLGKSENNFFSKEQLHDWLRPFACQAIYYLSKSNNLSNIYKSDILNLIQKLDDLEYKQINILKTIGTKISQEDIVQDGLILRDETLRKYYNLYKHNNYRVLIFSPDNGAWKFSFQGWKSVLEYMGVEADIIYNKNELVVGRKYDIFISIINLYYIEQIYSDDRLASIPYKIALPSKDQFSNLDSENDKKIMNVLLNDKSFKFCITAVSPKGIDYLFSSWQEKGMNIYSNMFGFNPLIHYPEYTNKKYKYFFVGHNSYLKVAETEKYIGTIFNKYPGGLLCGTGWGNGIQEIPPSKVRYYYNRSAINLNYHLESQKQVECEVNERTYIIGACGGFQLVDNPIYIANLYSSDELAIAQDPKQYVEMFEYYSNHSEERMEMAYRAMQRTYKNNSSLFQRMDDLLKLVQKHR